MLDCFSLLNHQFFLFLEAFYLTRSTNSWVWVMVIYVEAKLFRLIDQIHFKLVILGSMVNRQNLFWRFFFSNVDKTIRSVFFTCFSVSLTVLWPEARYQVDRNNPTCRSPTVPQKTLRSPTNIGPAITWIQTNTQHVNKQPNTVQFSPNPGLTGAWTVQADPVSLTFKSVLYMCIQMY